MIGQIARKLVDLAAGIAAMGCVGIALAAGLLVLLVSLASGLLAVIAGLWLLSQIPALPVVTLTLGIGAGLWWQLDQRQKGSQ